VKGTYNVQEYCEEGIEVSQRVTWYFVPQAALELVDHQYILEQFHVVGETDDGVGLCLKTCTVIT